MPKRYPLEQRERAVKMVLDHLDEYRSVYSACQVIGPKLGIGAESLRNWTKQAQIDAKKFPVLLPRNYNVSKISSVRTENSRKPTKF